MTSYKFYLEINNNKLWRIVDIWYPPISLYKYLTFYFVSVTYSPGGVAAERVVLAPDWVLDYWHPLEKAQYPEYFKKREERKKEFIANWEKEYGKYDPKSEHH